MPNSYESLNIETPENVSFGYEVAGIGSRFLAALVDRTIVLVFQGVVLLGVIMMMQMLDFDLVEADDRLLMWTLALISLVLFALNWGYYIFFELLWNGQSPGKRWVGLRVIQSDGAPVNLAASAIRNILRIIDTLPAFYGLGVVTMFIDSRSRRLGDLAARTVVVHDQAAITLDSLKAEALPLTSKAEPGDQPDLPVHMLTPADYHMAEEFLRRRAELVNRKQIAAQIALALLQRMKLPADFFQDLQAEKIIETIVAASRKAVSE